MSFSSNSDYHKNEFIPAEDIEKKLIELFPKETDVRESGLSPAIYRKMKQSEKEIGLIAAASDPGCHKCTRLRISCDGKLFVCLYQNKGVDLKQELRNKNIENLQEIIKRTIKNKRTYNPLKTKEETWMSLSQIGG